LVSDNGKGFIYNKKQESLGLKLINTLILEQLKGKLSIETEKSSNYRIEFK
jgi:two-component sensor histidine kinase